MTGLFDRIRIELRDAWRALRRAPGFAVVAILSIAIGIGACTAVFGLVNAVLLRLAPVRDPQALVLASRATETRGLATSYSYPAFVALQGAASLEGLAARGGLTANVEADGAAERASVEMVSGSFFELLGVRAYRGRLLTPDDDRVPGGHPVAVLGHGYWHRRFGGDPGVVGRTIRVNGQPLTVVGVTPPAFNGLEAGAGPDLRVTLAMQAEVMASASRLTDPREPWLVIVGRLKPGVSRSAAEAELATRCDAFLAAQQRLTGAAPAGPAPRLTLIDGSRGQPSLQRRFAHPLAILGGLAAAVLLLVCLNVANLAIARTLTRRRELAVRLALGGSRARVAGQLLVEAGLVAMTGTALGLVLARVIAQALARAAASATGGVPLAVPMNAGVVLVAALLGIGVAVACGLAPGLLARRMGAAGYRFSQRLEIAGGRLTGRRLLVAAQIALSLALLTGAGLFARTLVNLRGLDDGIDADRLLQARLDPTLMRADRPRLHRFYEELTERLAAVPGVESATAAAIPRLSRSNWDSGVLLDTGARDEAPGAERNAVTPGYFRTVGARFVEGREPTAADVRSGRKVAVVNEAFARRYFDGRALGRRIGATGPGATADVTIVGVVRDGKYVDLRESATPVWYVPYSQLEVAGTSDTAERVRLGVTTLYVRTAGDPAALAADVTRTIAALDPRVTVSGVRAVSDQLDDLLVLERVLASLASAFAAVAIFLAALGLYGVMAYDTTARTREIGVRLALGATPGGVLGLVLRQAAVLIGLGLALGVAPAVLVVRSAQTLLFGLDPADPVVPVTAAAIVVAVTAAAAYVPARRAARVDPAIALQ
jgi:putative ABC transport system permease protein